MSTSTKQRLRLRAHFAFTKIPFNKAIWARKMFDSVSQRELRQALLMWMDIHGIAVVIGPGGVGKSIAVRRFIADLDEDHYHVIRFSYMATTPVGFLRSLTRALGLPMRMHGADLFDAAQQHLVTYEKEQGPHPVIVIDDAEGLKIEILELLRRLTTFELDADNYFSVLLAGTEDFLRNLRAASLDPLRSRVGYTHNLRGFSLEDTRNYVRFHLQRAEGDPQIFSDEAVKQLFQASAGMPRKINQLALQALIMAAVQALERIDARFMAEQINNHPFYQNTRGE